MPDTDNTLLTKIAKSVKAIEVAFANQVPLPSEMDVTVTNFPDPQNVVVTNFPDPLNVNAAILTNFGKAVNYFSLSQGATGNTVIAAAVPGNRHKVVGFIVTLSVKGTVQFFSGASALTGTMDISDRGNLTIPPSPLAVSFQTEPGEALSITSAGGLARGIVAFLTEP